MSISTSVSNQSTFSLRLLLIDLNFKLQVYIFNSNNLVLMDTVRLKGRLEEAFG